MEYTNHYGVKIINLLVSYYIWIYLFCIFYFFKWWINSSYNG